MKNQFKVFTVYCESANELLKLTIPATSEQSAKEYCKGAGEILKVCKSDLQDIDLDCLKKTLLSNSWGQQEIDIITRTLNQCGLGRTY